MVDEDMCQLTHIMVLYTTCVMGTRKLERHLVQNLLKENRFYNNHFLVSIINLGNYWSAESVKLRLKMWFLFFQGLVKTSFFLAIWFPSLCWPVRWFNFSFNWTCNEQWLVKILKSTFCLYKLMIKVLFNILLVIKYVTKF